MQLCTPIFFCLGERKGSEYIRRVRNFATLLSSYSELPVATAEKRGGSVIQKNIFKKLLAAYAIFP
jgi:hypothetical protein